MQAKQVLHKLLQKVDSPRHKLRRTALAVNVMAARHGEVLPVTQLGRSITSRAKEKHGSKRADRLLSNRRLQAERLGIYSSRTRWLIGAKRRPVIRVDWSDLDECKRHFLLRASVPLRGRSLTLYEAVHPAKSQEKPAVHRRFLQRLQAMLPPACRPIMLMRGFAPPGSSKSKPWAGTGSGAFAIDQLQLGGEDAWIPGKALDDKATPTPKALGPARLTAVTPSGVSWCSIRPNPKAASLSTALAKPHSPLTAANKPRHNASLGCWAPPCRGASSRQTRWSNSMPSGCRSKQPAEI